MANPPRLQVSGLPVASAGEASATVSPARGREMVGFLNSRLNLNREKGAMPLVHSWEFWHDRQDRSSSATHSATKDGSSDNYEDRLEPLANISDVREFWRVFNNFDISQLKLRDSMHLFHKGIKPIWEDPRNARGGSWTFRVPKAQGEEFWKEICMMAIGEQLQQAVDDPNVQTFRDDICGVSLGLRYNNMLVQIWNRDGGHEAGVQAMLAVVLNGLAPELKPREGTYYYKKHSEHAGFQSTASAKVSSTAAQTEQPQISGIGQEMQSLDAIVQGP